MLRSVLPPLVCAYALFVAMVLLARLRPVGRPKGRRGVGTVPLGELARMIAGGYVVFVAIVLVFHVWLAGESESLADAVWGGAFLALIVAAAAPVLSILTRISGRG
jgi:hypothetical protein